MPLSHSIVQRLQRFGTHGRLRQAALRSVREPWEGKGGGGPLPPCASCPATGPSCLRAAPDSISPQAAAAVHARAHTLRCNPPRHATQVAASLPADSEVLQDLRGLFLELDPGDTGCVAYTRLQAELEARGGRG